MYQELSELEGERVTIENNDKKLGEQIGKGAEGYIYELENIDDKVVKIFKESVENKENKVKYLVNHQMNSPQGTKSPDDWTRWPRNLVFDTYSEDFLGYTMHYLDDSEFLNAQVYAEDHLDHSETTVKDRYTPAINLCLTVLWLHEYGYAVGDISDQNVRIRDGSVTIIDCDSFSIENVHPGAEMEAFRYRPPEGVGSTHTSVKESDLYGVAVHIFQFLMEGTHPCQARGDDNASLPDAIDNGTFAYSPRSDPGVKPPEWAPEFDDLPESIRIGFTQCFVHGYDTPKARPSLNEWLGALTSELRMDLQNVPTQSMDYDVELSSDSGDWYEEYREDSQEETGTQEVVSPTDTEAGDAGTDWDEIRADYSDDDTVSTSSSSTSTGSTSSTSPSSSQSTSSSSSSDDTISISVEAVQAIILIAFVLFAMLLLAIF